MDTAVFDKTSKEAYVIDVAVSNNHNPHSTVNEKFQMYTDLKEELIRMLATENDLYNTTSTTRNWYYPKQIAQKFKTT